MLEAHIYQGLCPDDTTGAASRDPECPACQMLEDVALLSRGWLRYEKLRKLNPRQFADLHARNLAGEFFDDLVDALPKPSTPMPGAYRATHGKEGA